MNKSALELPPSLHPERLEFREEWLDNIGGMANAIFWLKANWDQNQNANGIRMLDDGGHWNWNYSRHTETIIFHEVNGKGASRHMFIMPDKVVESYHLDDRNATIYRPFISIDGPFSVSESGIPNVEWRKTREVKIVENHYMEQPPLYVFDAIRRVLRMLKTAQFPQFPHLDLSALTYPINFDHYSKNRKAMVWDAVVNIYDRIYKQVMLLRTCDREFQEFHIFSYSALVELITDFNYVLESNGHEGGAAVPQYHRDHIKLWLHDSMNRAVKKGHTREAALLHLLYHGGTFENSLEYTTDLVKHNYRPEVSDAD